MVGTAIALRPGIVFLTDRFGLLEIGGIHAFPRSHGGARRRASHSAPFAEDLPPLKLQLSSGVIALLLYFERVSRLMILNLEAEKAVDSSKCLGVVSGHS